MFSFKDLNINKYTLLFKIFFNTFDLKKIYKKIYIFIEEYIKSKLFN